MPDRHELYELCVQTPEQLVPLLIAIHGASPVTLGEDFCGTAAVATTWVRTVGDGRAVAVDHDKTTLARAADVAGLQTIAGDVVDATPPATTAVDLVYTGNFSIGEWRDRPALIRYLRHVRARLNEGGVFICDLYGGENAFSTGVIEREFPLPDGRSVGYQWEQLRADPLTGQVENHLHFEVENEPPLRSAFVYQWRLWALPELRDAMLEAGFASTSVYPRVPDAIDDDGVTYISEYDEPEQLPEDWDVLVVARLS